jgi:hypothetical protein
MGWTEPMPVVVEWDMAIEYSAACMAHSDTINHYNRNPMFSYEAANIDG